MHLPVIRPSTAVCALLVALAAGASAPGAAAATPPLTSWKVVNYFPHRYSWDQMWTHWDPATIDSDFARDKWTQACDAPILAPALPWEKQCIEGAALCKHGGRLFMFYAGAYNNEPQQIGCAVSDDGIHWERLSEEPFLPNGRPGTWNASESGHPYAFTDDDGTTYLFYQGNNDNGRTWYLSHVRIAWEGGLPVLAGGPQ